MGRQVQQYMKIINSYRNKDELYDHLDLTEMEKVAQYVQEAMGWMNGMMNMQSKQSLTQDPLVKCADIRAKVKDLANLCNPIVNKPKPKVEPPKEEKEAEQNGPVSSEENASAEGPTPASAENAQNNTQHHQQNLPEMDIE